VSRAEKERQRERKIARGRGETEERRKDEVDNERGEREIGRAHV
jgi:hypothetical protein